LEVKVIVEAQICFQKGDVDLGNTRSRFGNSSGACGAYPLYRSRQVAAVFALGHADAPRG
jgi:hypothetical protein